MTEPWNLTDAQRRQFREARAEAKERAMTTKPTAASVTAILTRAGFPLASGIGGGIKVRPMEGGVICVDYDPGSFPVSKDDALAAIAGLLSAEGWMVTDAGRVLVSGG